MSESTTSETTATPTENVVYLIGELRAISRKTETKTGALMVRRAISIARHWTDIEGRFHEDYDEFEPYFSCSEDTDSYKYPLQTDFIKVESE